MTLSVTRVSFSVGASLFLLLSSACEPPGKPGQPEPTAQNIMDFKTLFADNCQACHGADGKNGPGRILNDGLYLSILPRETLKQILIYGRAGTAMPAWATTQGGPLTMKQIDALVDGIEKNWAKPVDFHGAQPPAYSAGNSHGDAASGQKLFLRDCFMCHGPGAKVGPVTDPEFLSLASNQMLRTSIIVGRPDLGMPDYRNLNFGKALSDQNVTDLVAFLASKRPENANTQEMLQKPEPGQESTPGNEGEQQVGGSGHSKKSGASGKGNKSNGSSSQQGIK